MKEEPMKPTSISANPSPPPEAEPLPAEAASNVVSMRERMDGPFRSAVGMRPKPAEAVLAADEACEPDEPMAAVQALIDVLPRLDTNRTIWFARSLIGQWFKSGYLSPKQWYWV